MIVNPCETSGLITYVKLVFFNMRKIWDTVQICGQCEYFYAQCPLTIKKYWPVTQQSCWSQILVKMINWVTEEVSPWNVSMSWLQKLKAAMHLLHWTKLASNLSSAADTNIDGKTNWTMCLTAHLPTLGKCIQAAMVYWHLWMIFFLGMCLRFMSRVW